MIYSFDIQHALGQAGESFLDSWLSQKYELLDVSGVPKYQKAGIDRLLLQHNGCTATIEYKCDSTASRTGNLFFETMSNDQTGQPGWGWSSQADYWIFLIPDEEILIFKPEILRSLVWREKSNLQEKIIPNKNYKTVGYPIPLSHARKKATSHKQIKVTKQLVKR